MISGITTISVYTRAHKCHTCTANSMVSWFSTTKKIYFLSKSQDFQGNVNTWKAGWSSKQYKPYIHWSLFLQLVKLLDQFPLAVLPPSHAPACLATSPQQCLNNIQFSSCPLRTCAVWESLMTDTVVMLLDQAWIQTPSRQWLLIGPKTPSQHEVSPRKQSWSKLFSLLQHLKMTVYLSAGQSILLWCFCLHSWNRGFRDPISSWVAPHCVLLYNFLLWTRG